MSMLFVKFCEKEKESQHFLKCDTIIDEIVAVSYEADSDSADVSGTLAIFWSRRSSANR